MIPRKGEAGGLHLFQETLYLPVRNFLPWLVLDMGGHRYRMGGCVLNGNITRL